jgi:hypothetical protein
MAPTLPAFSRAEKTLTVAPAEEAARLFTRSGRALSIILAASLFLFSSCATRPKTYTAPDATKVTAATKRLAAAIAKSGETAVRVEAKVREAQENFDRVAASSVSVLAQVHDLEQLVPAELKPRVADLKSAINAQIVDQDKTSESLSGARTELAEFKKDVGEMNAAKVELQSAQTKYQSDAAIVAIAATSERNHRIAAEKQLTQQKIFKWLWRIGGGAVVGGVILLFVTGKLSIKAIRTYFRI